MKSASDCHAKDMHYQKFKEISDIDKFDLLKNVWKTPPGYSFPQHVESNWHLRFNSSYVDANSPFCIPWLVYSAYYDGAFCLSCVLFVHKVADTKLKKLFTEPFTRWNGARTRWIEHQTVSVVHKYSVDAMHTYINQMEGREKRINDIIDDRRRENIRKNREKMFPIIKTVAFCGRQNIPLRDHRDDSLHLSDEKNNSRNFQALLDFL